jgi:ferredoxin
MSAKSHAAIEAFLTRYDAGTWADTIQELLPAIHEVDRAATQIWFKFFPLELFQALERAPDPAQTVRELQLQGKYLLRDQIDSSHWFFYGHRYWPQVRQALIERAEPGAPALDMTLAGLVREVATLAAGRVKAEPSLVIGITAVALMTVRQVGLAAFKAAPGVTSIDRKRAAKTPEQLLKARARDDAQGIFGFLRSVDKHWTVTFNEYDESSRFGLINNQDLATAGSRDTRDYKTRDPRCVEGPIPVECRTAACGTCWVGVLGGAGKLRPVEARERLKIREFGYIDTDDPQPVIRMACVARASGSISIVIPPWSGFFGKYLERERKKTDSVG